MKGAFWSTLSSFRDYPDPLRLLVTACLEKAGSVPGLHGDELS